MQLPFSLRFINPMFALFGVITGLLPAISMAESVTPFYIRNYHPFVQIYGIPYTGEASTLTKGDSRLHLVYALSSNYAIEKNNSETLLIDGETTNITLSYARGFGKSIQLAIYIPYVRHDSGSLDNFINDWHDTFSLKQGGRDLAPVNRLRFLYQRNGITELDFVSNTQGVGDISLNAQLALGAQTHNANAASAVSVNLKLPTGDSQSLKGSGAFDLGIWYKHERSSRVFDMASGYFYSTGLLLLGKGDVLPDLQRSAVFTAGGGGGLRLAKYVSLKAQLDYHSPFYGKTDFNELGGHSLQLVFGGSLHFTPNIKLDLGLSEDLIIDASPDVVFHVDFSAQF